MNIISNIDGRNISVEIEPNKNYGILLSGGLDSSIVLYCVVKDFLDKGLPINLQPFTIPLAKSEEYANKVIDWVNERLNTDVPYTIKVGDPTVHHAIRGRHAHANIREKYTTIDRCIQGTNQNPPPPFDLAQFGVGGYPDRVLSGSAWNYQPFIELYKSHIVDILLQLDLEGLSLITHSCTEVEPGRCNKCFQCKERHWAFVVNSKLDAGIN